MHRRCAVGVVLLLVLSSGPPAAAQAADAPGLKQLPPEVRRRIDRLADRAPIETAGRTRVDFTGDVIAWGIRRAVLPPERERRFATEVHATVLAEVPVRPTPEKAQDVFHRLLCALPPHLDPPPFDGRLTTPANAEANAFTIGGGFVYVHQPLLEGLGVEPERGPAALAFVLAHEIAHVALGHARRGRQLERIEQEIREGLETGIDDEYLRVTGGRAPFGRVGRKIAYLTAVYDGEKPIPVAPPLTLGKDGSSTLLRSRAQPVTLRAIATGPRRVSPDAGPATPVSYLEEGATDRRLRWVDGGSEVAAGGAGKEPLRFEAPPADGLSGLVRDGSKKLERIFTIENGRRRWS